MKTIIVDFDGVLHSYTSPWVNARTIPDPPVPGAMEFLEKAVDHFHVAIVSSRSHQWGGRAAMKQWIRVYLHRHFRTPMVGLLHPSDGEILRECGQVDYVMSLLSFPRHKPPAIMTIDDRAFCFKGEFPDMGFIHDFKPWNR